MNQFPQNKTAIPKTEDDKARTVQLPSWLTASENYTPPADADRYIGKSLFKLLYLLEKLNQTVKKERFPLSPIFKVLYSIELILLISMSTRSFFPSVIGTALLIYLAAQPGKDIVILLKKGILAAVFAFIITVPAIWLGNPYSCLIISGKTFLTVLIVAILSHSTQWNRITSALAQLHVPHLFVMILDLTLQYIAILGNVSLQLLQALQLRSVGKNNKKYQSLSGILGTTFLISKEFSEETYQAMVCRCFTGSYAIPRTHTFHKTTVLYSAMLIMTPMFYIWCEGVSKL